MVDAREEGRENVHEIAVATLEDRQKLKNCRTLGWDLLNRVSERRISRCDVDFESADDL